MGGPSVLVLHAVAADSLVRALELGEDGLSRDERTTSGDISQTHYRGSLHGSSTSRPWLRFPRLGQNHLRRARHLRQWRRKWRRKQPLRRRQRLVRNDRYDLDLSDTVTRPYLAPRARRPLTQPIPTITKNTLLFSTLGFTNSNGIAKPGAALEKSCFISF